ncbi:hypothetical protein GCM10008015_16870 [Flavobacterium palustre]|uniref:DUF4062 domain-containing protein n=1 Tax=Flavobacterium palustre TaxID=1476463 RepID=A0ABQ1HIK1_9FLAO|nr:DUF4062 domain-containing protein [Flavobacterium palustre]GGA76883.1 hypothetical protein GCM10008015_16870 [Flavobacterium palustre]
MKIKYQIFVSSTFEDLVEERELVIKAILEMGHIPVGMEMFSAGDEEQWKLIQRQIDDCDYYVVICAHRYGSQDGDLSYTEKEYDYAFSKGIPTLGFVIGDKAEWPVNKSDTDTQKKTSLDLFKNKIKKKLISYWQNKEDLYGKVSIALMKQFTTNPGVGWIKSNELAGPEVLIELTRLSKENSNFREEIKQLKFKIEAEETSKYDKLIASLRNHEINLSFYYKNGSDWEDSEKLSLYRIFKLLAPECMSELSSVDTAMYLSYFKTQKERELRATFPVPRNTIKQIFADFVVLNLVKPSLKKHSVKDENEYWTLTEEGIMVYKEIRRQIIDNPKSETETNSDGNDKKEITNEKTSKK